MFLELNILLTVVLGVVVMRLIYRLLQAHSARPPKAPEATPPKAPEAPATVTKKAVSAEGEEEDTRTEPEPAINDAKAAKSTQKAAKRAKGGRSGKEKGKEKEEEATPEEVQAMKQKEADCHSCAAPCDTHMWMPDTLQAKVKWLPMQGTVKPYQRHLLVSSGVACSRWASELDAAPQSFVAQLGLALKTCEKEIGYKVKVSLVQDDGDGDAGNDGTDVLVFPDMIRIKRVPAVQLKTFVQALLVSKSDPRKGDFPFQWEPLASKLAVLVCCHTLRDKRCGVGGPLLASEFERTAENRGICDDVDVYKVSHTGGHKFAGNIIVYPDGHWYGRVTTCHVEGLLDQHLDDAQKPFPSPSEHPLSRGPSGCQPGAAVLQW